MYIAGYIIARVANMMLVCACFVYQEHVRWLRSAKLCIIMCIDRVSFRNLVIGGRKNEGNGVAGR